MRRGWPLLVIFCSLTLAACAGTSNRERTDCSVASELDYLDRQKVELQACLGRFDGTQIERRESAVIHNNTVRHLFESDSDRIKPATCPEIDIVADVVKKYPETEHNRWTLIRTAFAPKRKTSRYPNCRRGS